jgi:hypothetical protein
VIGKACRFADLSFLWQTSERKWISHGITLIAIKKGEKVAADGRRSEEFIDN